MKTAAGSFDDEFFEDLEDLYAVEEASDGVHYDLNWRPKMGPTQEALYDCTAPEILVYGEKYSGKTYIAGGHKLVRHCMENPNALAVIIVGTRGQALQGGCWTKLLTMILPEWRDEMGLEYTEPRLNEQNHPEFWIRNKFGGYSKVVLVSLQHGDQIKSRMRGYEPSYVFVDEVTLLPIDVFVWVNLQIGRDMQIANPQWVGATNPEGPSHWVFDTFWREMGLEDQHAERPEDCTRQVFHQKIDENEALIEASGDDVLVERFRAYKRRIEASVKHDRVEYDRMVHGIWVDRPSGTALYAGYYSEELHVYPLDVEIEGGRKAKRIVPSPNWPIIVGWDPGASFNAIVWMQHLKGADKDIWTIFDEMVYINQRIDYDKITLEVMRRIVRWNRYWREKRPRFKGFRVDHISDDSAINQYRPGSGAGKDFDALKFNQESIALIQNKKLWDEADRALLSPIEMRAGPKYAGSVIDRTKVVQKLLSEERLFISPHCNEVRGTLMHLESMKEKGEYDPDAAFMPRRMRWIHANDALGYPLLDHDIQSELLEETAKGEPQMYPIGRGSRAA